MAYIEARALIGRFVIAMNVARGRHFELDGDLALWDSIQV